MEYRRDLFGEVFIDNNIDLRDESKLKLSYYKIINKDAKENVDFGIEIVKEQTNSGKVEVEGRKIVKFSKTEKDVDNCLNILKSNLVTPTTMFEVIEDLEKKSIYNKFSNLTIEKNVYLD